jgi:hypothetical protein
MKYLLILISVVVLASCTRKKNDTTSADYLVSTVNIRNVVIDDKFWLPKIRLIQDTTINYAFKKCDEEGRMKNFLIAGKVVEGKTCGKMPFDDTDLYKIIEGVVSR